MAGYRELLAIEWDAKAVETFRLNFPGVPVYQGDIAALSVEECLSLAGIVQGELDVLDGSPPCQGFSISGKRKMSDDRNQLYHEFTRLLVGLQPRVFLMENVSGMVKGKMRLIFVDILHELQACGYQVSARLLNAKYFGVPQSRQRIIFIGVRNGLTSRPSHPRPTHRTISVREAWEGLQNIQDDLLAATIDPKSVAAKIARSLRPGQRHQGDKYFNLVRAPWDAPCPTVTRSDGYSISRAGLMHPTEIRRPTIVELKRVGSFPDEWQMAAGTFGDHWAGIGNSVPPLFMRAIALHLRSILSDDAAGRRLDLARPFGKGSPEASATLEATWTRSTPPSRRA
jgi:DNA (cytosine-5)-methyltransferase 1